MTKVTNALATYDVTTNREDLTAQMYRISPADTPFMSAVPRRKASNVLHEWNQDALASVNTTNAQLEGDALTRSASTPPTRAHNYCQISRKDATVSGTQQASDPAGISDMMAWQMAKKGLELRKDCEAILLGNTGESAGSTTTARTLRSFNAWISGNGSRGANGADSTGATYAATDGTTGDLRTFTEDMLKDAIKDAYDDGGEPSLVLVGTFNKQKFSTFTGRATAREMVSVGTVQGAASIYASDFGDLKVVTNRTQRGRDCFVIDPTKVAVAYLRGFESKKLGDVGDAETRMINVEYTLQMGHENAQALVADLTTS